MMYQFKNRFFELKELKPDFFECTVFAVEPTDAEVKDFLNESDKILKERQRTGTIYQLENMKLLKAEHRITIGNWTKKNNDIIKQKTVCVGYKTDGILGKMVLNGIFIIQKPVFPYLISTNETEILAWMDKQFQESKIGV